MVGIIKRSTANFKLGIPFFDAPGWGAAFERDMDIIDAVLATAGTVTNIIGAWANSTVYGSDDRVVDVTDNSVWQASVSHTSAAAGTFAADRAAHPTYWDAVSTSVVVREEFVTGTDYFVGDFVYSTVEHLGGIVKTAFTGGANLRINIANLGIIFDLKADLTAIPTIQANVLALQNGSQLHALTASAITDADEVGFWEDVAGLLRKITWASIKTTLASTFLPLAGGTLTGLLTGTTLTLSGLFSGTTATLSGLFTGAAATFSGLVTITSGQIKFPAVQVPSADPNTLDDYEEGTWTPRIAGTTIAGTGTYTTQLGEYTKIGDRCMISAKLVWTAHTGTGFFRVTDMPFIVAGSIESAIAVFPVSITYAGDGVCGYIEVSGSNSMSFSTPSTAGGATLPMDAAGTMYLSGHYKA